MKVHHRDNKGISLIEMLATVLIMGFVGAGITEICVTQNVVAFRTFNKVEALTNARRVASFIERDIHNAKFVGDEFGAVPYQFPGGIPAGSLNPYGTSGPNDPTITGFLGFPGDESGTNWLPPPYTLNAQTLILQLPIFTTSLTGGVAGLPTRSSYTNSWNVDTVVYQVVADQTHPSTGQFILQKTVFPGEHPNAGYSLPPVGASNAPQTILTGIVGPIDPIDSVEPTANTPRPKIFGYFSKQYPIYSTTGSSTISIPLSSADPGNINGVSINLELFSNANSKRADLTPKSMAFRTEIYLRGNYWSP